jgi:hypothetical protein
LSRERSERFGKRFPKRPGSVAAQRRIPHHSLTEKQLHSSPFPKVLGLFLSQDLLDVAGLFMTRL